VSVPGTERGQWPLGGKTGKLAAIDIGSHTARLLIAEAVDGPRPFRPILRKRDYVRLAEAFNKEKGTLSTRAIERTLKVLEDFAAIIKAHKAQKTLAVCTGVARSAANREELLNPMREKADITARVISWEEESFLTAKGTRSLLALDEDPIILFDLGGWTTEFVWGSRNEKSESVLLGSLSLKEQFLSSDPPVAEEINLLMKHVEEILAKGLGGEPSAKDGRVLIGTGGTVTTLAAMIHGIGKENIDPDRMNGLKLSRQRIECLFEEMRALPLEERLKNPGLDHGRADVIVAGIAAVIGILGHLGFTELTVSLSDILEGLIISQLEGE